MTNLQIFNYNESPIEFEIINGQIMANATLMFAANGARLDHWKNSAGTERYINAVTQKLGNGTNDLIIVRQGGNDKSGQGTWIHERLILNAARYISVDFEIWCDEKIAELLRTGSTSIKPLSMEEMMIQQLQGMIEQKRQLEAMQQETKQLTATVEEIKAKQSTIATEYYSVSGWYGLHKTKLDLTLSQCVGRKCSKLSRDMGILIGKAYDAKYGQINTFHKDVLQTIAPLGNVAVAVS